MALGDQVAVEAQAQAQASGGAKKQPHAQQKKKKRTRARGTPPPESAHLLAALTATQTSAGAVPSAAVSSAAAAAAAVAGAAVSVSADEVEDVEYVSSIPDDLPEEFVAVFERLARVEEMFAEESDAAAAAAGAGAGASATAHASSSTATGSAAGAAAEGADAAAALSKRKRKKLSQLTVAQLKQLVMRPDLVESWDVTAADPRFLLYLKAHPHSVPVPRHWHLKRKYLQGKRGVPKQPFELPGFIKNTGIQKLRETASERASAQTASQKGRERVRPKIGRLDIDYQVLYDAFFKYQTKPRLSSFGDLYYEGREWEVRGVDRRPGNLSDELKAALGMAAGAPPPWLINMQRHGPPPSYPSLRIPGLNAPIPAGAQWGFHPGGWGKPPVDEANRPLYGDVFGTSSDFDAELELRRAIDHQHWGEIESESEDEMVGLAGADEGEAEGAEGAADAAAAGGAAAAGTGAAAAAGAPSQLRGAEQRAGIASTATFTGIETPQVVDLRKTRADDAGGEKSLYTVLQQVDNKSIAKGGFLPSAHTYVIPGSDRQRDAGGAERVNVMRGQQGAAMDIAFDPSELEHMDAEAMRQKIEESAAQRSKQQHQYVDVSAARMEEEARRAKRANPSASSSSAAAASSSSKDSAAKKTKAYKDVKF